MGRSAILALLVLGFAMPDASRAAETLVLSWEANSEPDLAGYKVYYGRQSGQFEHVFDVGQVTQFEIGELQGGVTYFFVVTAYDSVRNESLPSPEVAATTPNRDTTPPALVDVQVRAKNSLMLFFSEKIDPAPAQNTANYQISGGLQVKSASLQSDSLSVNLVTSDHQNGATYVLTVANIRDRANPPNSIKAGTSWSYLYLSGDTPPPAPADTTAPRIINVQVLAANQLEVVFSEKVLQVSAENKANYLIKSGIGIGNIALQQDGRSVMITTAYHSDGAAYELHVSNIADLAEPANQMPATVVWPYTYHQEDREPPRLIDVTLLDQTHVHILFSEKITPATANEKTNFMISDGVVVNSASLQPSQKEVVLATTLHEFNRQYTLQVSGIRDQSPYQNLIAANATFAYLKPQPPDTTRQDPGDGGNGDPGDKLAVDGLSRSGYQLATVSPGNRYYIDRSYYVVNLPQPLQDLLWIKTANSDWGNDREEFLSFNLAQPMKVYIAYDSRSTSPPDWLRETFHKTRYEIEVSDPAKYLQVWEAILQPGKVTFGGNLAKGAQDARSMYVVLFDPANLQLSTDTDGPKEYALYPNYPNPFNPRTDISFYLQKAAFVELTVYNMRGRLIKKMVSEQIASGLHRITWNATDHRGRILSSGMYMLVLEIKEQIQKGDLKLTNVLARQTRMMTLLK